MGDNLSIWKSLGRTDPKHTKPFKRAGGFKGTAIKPIWCEQRMTEEFGPCGKGWGIEEPSFQVVPGHNDEVLVYCTVSLWWRDGGEVHSLHGVGGDKVVTYIRGAEYVDGQTGERKTREPRWENDDEAFKKAFTDAIGNAMKHLGMAADVHMGLFDDSKYVKEAREEFAEEEREAAKAKAETAAQPKGADPFADPPAARQAEPAPKAKTDFWSRPSLDLDPKKEKSPLQFADSFDKALAAAPTDKAINKLARDNDMHLDRLAIEERDLCNALLEKMKERLAGMMAA